MRIVIGVEIDSLSLYRSGRLDYDASSVLDLGMEERHGIADLAASYCLTGAAF